MLTPCLNAAPFIDNALASAAGQGVSRLEHIVQDGGSTDGTLEILQGASGIDWRAEADSGQSQALNRAFARSSGAWIAWLNADEFYLPAGLQTLGDAAARTGADVVYGTIAHVDAEGSFTGFGVQHPYSRFALSRVPPFIASCAVLIRRDFLPAVPWDEDLRMAMDWDLYLTLAERGARFLYVPYPVAAFRSHEGQVTAEPGVAHGEVGSILTKHGIGRRKIPTVAGEIAHQALWAAGGRLRRRGPARSMRGADLRWFREDVGEGAARELIARCYPRSEPGPEGERNR